MFKNDSSSTWLAHSWIFAATALLMLVILNYLHEVLSRFAAYRSLYKDHAFYVPEGIDKIGGIVLCVLAVWVLRRVAWKDIADELGLADPPLPALCYALVASSPMLIGFVLTRSLTPHMEPRSIFFLNRNFSDSGRNRISRPWRACSSTRNGLALLDIGLAPSPVIRVGAHRARTKPPRDGRVDATYRLGSGGVRLACLPLAEPLVSYRPSYLHESLVGTIQRRQKCIGWLVSVRLTGGEYLAGHRDNSVLDEAKVQSQAGQRNRVKLVKSRLKTP
jgi:hypothetical protein